MGKSRLITDEDVRKLVFELVKDNRISHQMLYHSDDVMTILNEIETNNELG
jgi:hypothetical protein